MEPKDWAVVLVEAKHQNDCQAHLIEPGRGRATANTGAEQGCVWRLVRLNARQVPSAPQTGGVNADRLSGRNRERSKLSGNGVDKSVPNLILRRRTEVAEHGSPSGPAEGEGPAGAGPHRSLSSISIDQEDGRRTRNPWIQGRRVYPPLPIRRKHAIVNGKPPRGQRVVAPVAICRLCRTLERGLGNLRGCIPRHREGGA